jgi:putative DNA primase/helicase
MRAASAGSDGMRDGEPERAALRTIDRALRDAIGLPKDGRDALIRDARRCESANGVDGILKLASVMQPVAISSDRLDQDPYLFGTTMGTLDLHTGAVRPPQRKDHITKRANTHVGDEASAAWLAFLEQVLPDPQVRDFLARLFGLALLGQVREHVMPVFAGSGANGKSTLRDVLLYVFGSYGVEVDPALLMAGKHERHGAFKMRLRGARLVFTSETTRGSRFDEAAMKRLTGGEPIEANLMRQNPIQFDPSHLLVMLTNHLPAVTDDDAVWRRLFIVPFDVVIAEEDRDAHLADKLKAEAPGVLHWVFSGWLDYVKQGLNPPDVVRVRTQQYRQDSDAFTRFFADCCGTGGSAKAGALYGAWREWCEANGEMPGTSVEFAAILTRRGYTKRKSDGVMVYRDIHVSAGQR